MYVRAICCFGPYTILAWTAQSVNCHIALKAMYYVLMVGTLADVIVDLIRIVNSYFFGFDIVLQHFHTSHQGPSF